MDAREEIGEIGDVLLRTAVAVRDAQEWLHGLSEGPILALPRAAVDLSFGLRIETGRRTLVRRRRGEQLLNHRLRFAVVATPEPPSWRPAGFRRELVRPSFLLTEEEQADWRERLAADLGSGRWRFPPREGQEPASLPKQVAREGKRVGSSQRMVFFHLPEERVLAVRVAPGRSGRRDGLFVYERRHSERPWAVYNFKGDGSGRVQYRPLALLVRSLREWRVAGEPTVRTAATLSSGIDMDTFQEDLEAGLSRALEALSRRRADESPAGYVDLDGIEALLSFSLGEKRGVDLSRAADETDPERDDLPASVVRIRLEPAAEPPRVTTELAELEYLLAGDDRRSAVELVAAAASEEPLLAHRGLIEDRARQDLVVVLRAFHKRQERLLVIWPAGPSDHRASDGEDLVLTCSRHWRRRPGRYEIGRVEIVKRPGDPMSLFTLANDAGPAADFQYRPFHRFFRAVLAWQLRGADPE